MISTIPIGELHLSLHFIEKLLLRIAGNSLDCNFHIFGTWSLVSVLPHFIQFAYVVEYELTRSVVIAFSATVARR